MQAGQIWRGYNRITAGLENSINLFDEPVCLGQMLYDRIGMNDIEALRCQGYGPIQIRLADSDSPALCSLRSLLKKLDAENLFHLRLLGDPQGKQAIRAP